jgi:hypothetical protein
MSQDRPGWNPPPSPSFEPTAPTTPDVAASSGPRRSRIGTGIAIAAIGIGALGVAGTAYASSSSPSPSPSDGSRSGYGATGSDGAQKLGPSGSAGPRADGDRGHRSGGPGMGMGPGGGMGPGRGMEGGFAIHGSFVTPNQGGGYQTVDTQRGTVTGVSATSITVTSVDGFTATYTVSATTRVHAQRDGIASVTTGDEVGVTAIESGSEKTAVSIVDTTALGGNHDKDGMPGAGKPASPAPTSTA